MNFSNQHRSTFTKLLSADAFDLLVIGGGITGCGVALDAALRGMKVALVEQNDFASGTSSRSTKLIHGGLRYLKQFEVKLVYEVGREREIVHKNARHLVLPEKMLLPITDNGSLGKFSASIGLMAYDLLAGVKRKEWRKMLDKQQTLKAEPLLESGHLIGGGLYYEYKTDDARLTMEVAKSAHANGATLLNYAEVKDFTYDGHKKITGAKILDKVSGNEFSIHAKVVVNACGPWVDMLRKKDDSLKGKRLLLTKGVHLVFPYSKLPIKQALYFDTEDGRMIFAIPRGNTTYVGTTDTVYNQEIEKPHCNKEDVTYLLNAANKMFPSVKLQQSDIESSWAGLRPLIYEDGKSPSELSRKDEIMISPTGLISIAGGKLTGYRKMSEKIVDVAAKRTGKDFGSSKTKKYRLSGSEFENDTDFAEYIKQLPALYKAENVPPAKLREWFNRYGKNMNALVENVKMLRDKMPVDENLFSAAELTYGIEHEMVYHLDDFLTRRSGKLFFDRLHSENQIEPLGRLLATQLQLPESVLQQMVATTKEEFAGAVLFQ